MNYPPPLLKFHPHSATTPAAASPKKNSISPTKPQTTRSASLFFSFLSLCGDRLFRVAPNIPSQKREREKGRKRIEKETLHSLLLFFLSLFSGFNDVGAVKPLK